MPCALVFCLGIFSRHFAAVTPRRSCARDISAKSSRARTKFQKCGATRTVANPRLRHEATCRNTVSPGYRELGVIRKSHKPENRAHGQSSPGNGRQPVVLSIFRWNSYSRSASGAATIRDVAPLAKPQAFNPDHSHPPSRILQESHPVHTRTRAISPNLISKARLKKKKKRTRNTQISRRRAKRIETS